VHEILILSGKGGTGKTSLSAAFAQIAANHLICDLDVDAPDLHLLLHPEKERTERFHSGHEAVVIPEACTNCGQCATVCRFNAIRPGADHPGFDSLRCEGCKTCVVLCPSQAIAFPEKLCGEWYVSRTRFGPMVHAQLYPGEENSGKLVALLRREAREMAASRGLSLILSDGPPGIGCPVISALSGTTFVVAVTEPTPSGFHDLKRALDLCRHFGIPAGVVINKADLNPAHSDGIADYCREQSLPLFGRLPHDPTVTRAMIQGETYIEFAEEAEISKQTRDIWKKILEHLTLS